MNTQPGSRVSTLAILRNAVAIISLIPVGIFISSTAAAQTGTVGVVVGTITDSTGAVVPRVEVLLVSEQTGQERRATSNAAGQYTLTNLPPGEYRVVVSAKGFRTTTLPVRVEVARSTQGDIALEVGDLAEAVEVTANSRTALQTTDASIGDVVGGREIVQLPTAQRNVLELTYLQVGTVPAMGASQGRSGSVGGTRSDQNTMTIDGVDTSDRFTSAFRGISLLRLPVDAVEEFRSVSANTLADTHGSGAYMTVATRRGTNSMNGALMWYHQNDSLNANTWTRNFLGQPKPELQDNRYGGRVGGPIWRDKTFFFGLFEGRRFPQSSDGVRIVATDAFRQGILRFRDNAGNLLSFNMNPANGPISAACGPTASSTCDPRGVGASPLVLQYLNTLYPGGNDPASGDGLNTIGLRAPADTSEDSDTWVTRIDHNLTSKWQLSGSFVRQSVSFNALNQLEIDPAVAHGGLVSLRGNSQQPRHVVAALTGIINPTLVNDFRVGWNSQDFDVLSRAFGPQEQLQLPAAGMVLDLAAGTLDDPRDPVISRARPQLTKQRHWSIKDDLTWTRGAHTVQAGYSLELRQFVNGRPSRGSASTTPVANITAGSFVNIPASQRPPTCSTTLATNCLRSADVSRWNTLYASLLGIWNDTSILSARDANGTPTGALFVTADMRYSNQQLRFLDTWRINNSLTLTAGINFMREPPLDEHSNLDHFIVDAATGDPIQPREYLRLKEQAAEQGRTYNASIAYVPAESVGRGLYHTKNDLQPRISVAWNPSFTSGLLGRTVGDRRTVLRAGYSKVSDRIMGSSFVLGFGSGNELMASTAQIAGPTCEVAGTAGPNCTPGVTPFRIGTDGQSFAPTPAPTISVPLIPRARNTTIPGSSFGVSSGFAVDPSFELGDMHTASVSVQRSLPKDLMLEVGWMGRWGRGLMTYMELNAPPVHIRDMSGLSNQTFAQAFDVVAGALRAGTPAASVPAQPWFENTFGPGSTSAIAAAATTNFIRGQVDTLFINTIDPRLQQLGKPTILNQQFDSLLYTTNAGWSNYNGFFVQLSKRFSHGISASGNWTWSHALDTNVGIADDFVELTNPYDPGFDYSDSRTDVRHVVKAYGTWELPWLKDRRLLGGWTTSFVFLARTGLFEYVNSGASVFGGGASVSFPTVDPSSTIQGSVNHNVAGSNGVGTTGNPATGGTGLSLFDNPENVYNMFRPFLLSQDTRNYTGALRGLGLWNIDLSIAKNTRISDHLTVRAGFDFFNLFNHPTFDSPSTRLDSPTNFGVITGQSAANEARANFVGPRRIQFFMRLEF
jgi:hypothetical protein